MFSYLKHLNNCNDFLRISGGQMNHFRVIDRKLILSGYETEIVESNGMACYRFWKKQDKEKTMCEWLFLHGLFNYSDAQGIVRYKNKIEQINNH